MHPLNALGLDSMNSPFYQHFWPTVGDCVTKCELDFLNLGVISSKFNVVSRIVSNILANRLKVVLPTIISKNQNAFMSNRVITDNILVDFEVMNHISQK